MFLFLYGEIKSRHCTKIVIINFTTTVIIQTVPHKLY